VIEIELNGEHWPVAVRREADRWIAEVDGRAVDVSVVEVGGRWSMLAAEAGPDSPPRRSDSVESAFSRSSYEIAFEPGAAGELIVHVNGVAIPLTITSAPDSTKPRTQAGRGAAERREVTGPRMIVAPMPGRIVKVLVKPNEGVSARQPLVVIEAMKMENELRAPRSGTVAEVRVAEGSSVEANTVLVVLR
jgi:biotin carboxyl carrier protein